MGKYKIDLHLLSLLNTEMVQAMEYFLLEDKYKDSEMSQYKKLIK